MKFADAHVHIGFFPCKAKNGELFYYSPEKVFLALQRSNISEFIFSSTDAVFYAEREAFVQKEIKKMLPISNQHGYAFCWITLDMIRRDSELSFLDVLPYSGIKLHARETDWSKNPDELHRIFKAARERYLPIMFHADDDFPPDLYEDFLSEYPDVKVCMAHARPVEKAILVMKKFRQVYTDFSFAPIENVSKLFMNKELIPRIMFGSDIPAPQRFIDQDIDSYLEERLKELSCFYCHPYRDVFFSNMKHFLRK